MKIKLTKELIEGFKLATRMRVDERICEMVKENINFSHQNIDFPQKINYPVYEKIDDNVAHLEPIITISLTIEALIEQEIKYNIYDNKYLQNALNVVKGK